MRTITAKLNGPTEIPAAKDPADNTQYRLDWGPLLTALGETIQSSVWTVESGLTAGISTVSPPGAPTMAEIWLSGGTAGWSYEVANTITTNTARVLRRSMVVRVVGR
ncbi:MAG: hypothetical protein OEY97_13520 [Nitrospirota bacterium]|nr:hypothetical protein [Nitrospirota bacterium]